MFDGERILLAERGREPLKGYWSLPGGVLEIGESLDAGIRREVLEETGLEVRTAGVGEVFERIMRDKDGRVEYHYVLIDYFCEIVGGALCAGDDCSAVRWFMVRDLAEILLTDGTLGVIEKAYSRYRSG